MPLELLLKLPIRAGHRYSLPSFWDFEAIYLHPGCLTKNRPSPMPRRCVQPQINFARSSSSASAPSETWPVPSGTIPPASAVVRHHPTVSRACRVRSPIQLACSASDRTHAFPHAPNFVHKTKRPLWDFEISSLVPHNIKRQRIYSS